MNVFASNYTRQQLINEMNADEIKEYCKARLQEIECINHVSHTPSAMVALAAFVGYLSRLAFWGRKIPSGIKNKTKCIDTDEEAFNAFIENFLPKYKKYYSLLQTSGGQNTSAKKYWLYVLLRCGLVHSMSFFDKWKPNKKPPTLPLPKPNVVISHDSEYSNLSGPLSYTDNGYNAIIINAFDLCVDLKQAIEVMFQVKEVRKNAERFVKYQPPIQDLNDNSVSLCVNNGTQCTISQLTPSVTTQVPTTQNCNSKQSEANPPVANGLSC